MARLVLIACAATSFRRAGIAFGKEPVLVDLDELTEEQQDALYAEPELTIEPADEAAIARLQSGKVDDADVELELLRGDVRSLGEQLVSAEGAVADRDKEIARLKERIAELEKAPPPASEPPAAPPPADAEAKTKKKGDAAS